MTNSLKKYTVPKFSGEDTDVLSNLAPITEAVFMLFTCTERKIKMDSFTRKFCKSFEDEIMQIPYKMFQKLWQRTLLKPPMRQPLP